MSTGYDINRNNRDIENENYSTRYSRKSNTLLKTIIS